MPWGLGLGQAGGGGGSANAGNVFTPVNAEVVALQQLWLKTQFPSYEAQSALDTLISSLKLGATSGTNLFTSRFDGIYVMAGFDSASSLKNLKTIVSSPGTFDLVNNNCAFSIARGFTGDGVGTYLETNFDPFVDATKNYQQTNCHMAAHTSTVSPNNGTLAAFFGNKPASGTSAIQLWINNGSSGSAWRVTNSGGPSAFAGAAVPYNRAYLLQRTASNAVNFYRDLTPSGTSSQASTALTANSLLKFLGDGQAGFSSNAQMTWGTFGSSLSLAEWTDTYNAFNTYLGVIGAL